jgi:hypothetical protein
MFLLGTRSAGQIGDTFEILGLYLWCQNQPGQIWTLMSELVGNYLVPGAYRDMLNWTPAIQAALDRLGSLFPAMPTVMEEPQIPQPAAAAPSEAAIPATSLAIESAPPTAAAAIGESQTTETASRGESQSTET